MFNLHYLAAAKEKKKAMAKQAISYFRGDNVACRPSEISAYFFIILTLVSK